MRVLPMSSRTRPIISNAEHNECSPKVHMETMILSRSDGGELHVRKGDRPMLRCQICETPTDERCSKCNRMGYCCKDHLLSDWPRHKKECKNMRKNQAFRDEKWAHAEGIWKNKAMKSQLPSELITRGELEAVFGYSLPS